MWKRNANNAGRFTEHAWAYSNALLHLNNIVKPATVQYIHSLLDLAAEQLHCNSWALSALLRGATHYWFLSLPRVSSSVLRIGMLAVFQLWSQSNTTNVCFFCDTHLGQPPLQSMSYSYFALRTDPLHRAHKYSESFEQIRLPNCQLLFPTRSLGCHLQSHVPNTPDVEIERQWSGGCISQAVFFMPNETAMRLYIFTLFVDH